LLFYRLIIRLFHTNSQQHAAKGIRQNGHIAGAKIVKGAQNPQFLGNLTQTHLTQCDVGQTMWHLCHGQVY